MDYLHVTNKPSWYTVYHQWSFSLTWYQRCLWCGPSLCQETRVYLGLWAEGHFQRHVRKGEEIGTHWGLWRFWQRVSVAKMRCCFHMWYGGNPLWAKGPDSTLLTQKCVSCADLQFTGRQWAMRKVIKLQVRFNSACCQGSVNFDKQVSLWANRAKGGPKSEGPTVNLYLQPRNLKILDCFQLTLVLAVELSPSISMTGHINS